ncbi:Unannotated [Lentimonas sp. CC19]|nr:Unannotated [Lentimonas sp. CC19]CAA6694463.1 Unannotated [Lentimonas sp. CC10]CAA7070605.1 Unannotated [Lentimonas sp. CC11]
MYNPTLTLRVAARSPVRENRTQGSARGPLGNERFLP